MSGLAKVLFDADCPACKKLADFAAKRTEGAEYLSWQEFRESAFALENLSEVMRKRPANELRVWSEGALLEGPDAWAFLLEKNRDLAGLGWLASQIGLEKSAARTIDRAGNIVRRLCIRCPKERR